MVVSSKLVGVKSQQIINFRFEIECRPPMQLESDGTNLGMIGVFIVRWSRNTLSKAFYKGCSNADEMGI